MDGGIQPTVLRIRTQWAFEMAETEPIHRHKEKMMWYSENPRLLPLSRNENINVAQKYDRVIDGANGHYKQWVKAA
jgi:hypothetical protein